MFDLKKLEALNDIRILYVEDDEDIKEEISEFLESEVLELFIAKDGEEAIEIFREKKPDIVITDIQMPKLNGLELATEIKKIDKLIPIIITTAFNENEYLLKSINIGIDKYVLKPINLNTLIDSIYHCVESKILKSKLNDTGEYVNFLLDNSLDFIFVVKNNELEYVNTKLINYFGYESFEDFKNSLKNSNLSVYRDNKLDDFNDLLVFLKKHPENIIYLQDKVSRDLKPYFIKFIEFKKLNRYIFSFVDILKFNFEDKIKLLKEKDLDILDINSNYKLLISSKKTAVDRVKGKIDFIEFSVQNQKIDNNFLKSLKNHIYSIHKNIDLVLRISENRFLISIVGLDRDSIEKNILNRVNFENRGFITL